MAVLKTAFRHISVYLDDELLERINEYIRSAEKKAGCNIVRSVVIRKIMRLGLDELTKEQEK